MPRFTLSIALASLLLANAASAQEYPMMDKLAQKVIQKYQTTSCADLARERGQPATGQKAQAEQRAMAMLRSDPKMRTAFLNRVAAPIANKMFECGMIP